MLRDIVIFLLATATFIGGYFLGKANRQSPLVSTSAPLAVAPAAVAPEIPVVPVVAEKKLDTIRRQHIPVAGVLKGTPHAPITIIEFTDFQCPFCARVAPTIDQLLLDYPGKIRFYVRHNPLPFHTSAALAAEAAVAAESEGKFWDMHNKLLTDFYSLEREHLDKYARDLGLDMQRFTQALDTRVYRVRVDQDQAVAVKAGANGTPAFFINGRLVSGARPIEAFKEVIDEELTLAEKLLADGTPADKLYEALIASTATTNNRR